MPKGGVLHRARELVDQFDFPAAQQLLRDSLNSAPAQPADAGDDDADTAALYAGVLLQLGEPNAARGWAAYAHAASLRLYGNDERRTLHALGVLACALHRSGALGRAAHHYHQLIATLTGLEGSDGDRTLAARADAAVVDHARGACAAARDELTAVIAAHAALHGPSHPVGIRMVARLAGMWRDCGDFDAAHQLLDQAKAAAAALAPTDDTHRLLVAAARAEADRGHVCGIEPTTAPAPAAGVFAVPAKPMTPQRPDAVTRQRPAPPPEWPRDELPRSAAPGAALTALPSAPQPSAPQPLFGTAPLYVPAAPPAPPRTLPRPIPGRGTRSRLPVAAMVAGAAVIAAATALVAVAVVASRADHAGNATDVHQSASPSAIPQASTVPARPTPEPEPVPTSPVTDLDMIDEGDRLLVSWTYPAGATAQVIISASKAGEPMKALQSLPAGTESFVFPGLDPEQDYCVAVTMAYGADSVVMSAPVCTVRTRPSPSLK